MVTNKYDIIGFANNLELELEDISDLFVSYIDELEDHCTRLNAAFLKKDFDELHSAVHNIKGLSGNLWIDDVFQQASLFDDRLKNNNYENAKECLDTLVNLIINSKYKIRESFLQANISL
jgi:HPt (histidine-containing phosphotransfer) domain-containing protein